MDNKELFDGCLKEAIRIARPHMLYMTAEQEPTQQEWDLAMVLFKKKLEEFK